MDNIKAVVAKNLVSLRKQNKLTQLELAEKISYSDKAVSRWENGEVSPDLETLFKLSEIYKIPVGEFFNENLDVSEIKKEERVNKINKLVVSLLAVSCVWFLAMSLFITFQIYFAKTIWQIFIYAIPVTFIVGIIFNSLWGRRILNFIFISSLSWSTILSVYIRFLQYNINNWHFFMLGIPIQVAVILWSQIKKRR